MKTCIKCNIEKSFDNFYKESIRKDGFRPYCKQCTNAQRMESYYRSENYKNQFRTYIKDGKKACTSCQELKSFNEYHVDKSRTDGYCPYCKTCKKKQKHEQYLKKTEGTCKRRDFTYTENNLKYCTLCKKEKPLIDFDIDKQKTDGYRSHCKECSRKEKSTLHVKILRSKNNKHKVAILADSYIKDVIEHRTGLKGQDISAKLIEAYRLVLQAKRKKLITRQT